MYIEQLKSNSTSETLSLKEQPEIPKQDALGQRFVSDTVAETESEQAVPANTLIVMTNIDFKLRHFSWPYLFPQSLTPLHEKYEKSFQKITMLKREKNVLELQFKEKDNEISE